MRRRIPFLRTVIALGVALVLSTVGVLVFARVDRVVVAPGRLVGATVLVRAPWAGQVQVCRVRPGQTVAAGEPLLELRTDALHAERTRISSRLDGLGSRIAALEAERAHAAGELHPGEHAQAERSIERARLELAQARARAEALEQLRTLGLVSQLELEQAELGRDLASVELDAATEERPLLEARQTTELESLDAEIRAAEAERAEQRSHLAELEHALSQSIVVAEAGGVVVGEQLEQLPGRVVAEGEVLLRVATGRVERFEGVLADRGRAICRVGLRAKVRLDAYPWLVHGSLVGTVARVADGPDASGSFPVAIDVDPSTAPGELYEGMHGQARVIVAERVPLGRLLIEKAAGVAEP